jgi:cyclic-di-GMP phosphodiesterase TipF (flagellum assembly factor)
MLRIGAIFIVICMVLIAGASGTVLYLVFGLSGTESTIVALAALTAMALYNAVTTRLRDRSDLGDQIADLSRGSADLSRQLAEVGRRLATLESQGPSAGETARAATAPISAELGELGTLVKQLAETVAAHDAALAGNAGKNSAADQATDPSEPATPPAKSPSETATADNREDVLAAIRSAIDAHRIDMHLQPIVTLPQRKVRYYEALTRLRTEDGHMLPPAEFLEPAETGGLLGRLDHLLLFRCVQVLRRLLLKNREIGLFCNISATTLNDPQYFPQMVQFLEANRVLAPSLVLEFKQSAWRDMGPLELESLATLRELGFRFCMDQVADLRIEPRDLGERGVRFVKVPAAVLLARTETSDIHAADLSDLLHRHGISLIADKIEAENQVVELLDYDMRFGQGFLFSPPRPVRAEALQVLPERQEAGKEGAKRDGGTAEQPRAAAV